MRRWPQLKVRPHPVGKGGHRSVKAFQLQLTRPELEVVEEALDLYCKDVHEDWDGHLPPAAKVACVTAAAIKKHLERTLTREAG